MDFKIQLTGLNELLSIIYGNEMKLSVLLRELGFEEYQIEQVRDKHLKSVVTQFLEVIHKRLTNDAGRDGYYQILSRHYGLDGIQRCQSKTWQSDLKKSLKYIVVAQLDKMNERPRREHVAEKLERLSNLRGASDVARLDYEAKRAEILKQIQAELDALDSEYKPILESAEENMAALENEIKTDVLIYGESISGGAYRATYTKGRVSWDNEGMEKYAASHADVLQFRKQGQPIVSLRIANKD
jgi:hypothetical protein